MKFEESAYEERIASLFSRFQSVQQAGFTSGAYKPGLAGMETLDRHLGHPWKRFRCIHVAGTNGKGSVSSMLASVLAAQGFSVGLYTSPHLLDFRERIKLVRNASFSMIPREEVWEFLETCENVLDGCSFFEITTAMAFRWFARSGVDFAVIEAGLGGRLDSTNIIVPELAVITSIGLDHCALLGNSRAEIAAEKAGIFKPGVPAVIGSRDGETAPVFEEAARSTGCPLFFASDSPFSEEEEGLLSRMDLRGPCQRENLHTCLSALKVLEDVSGSALPQFQARSLKDALVHTAERTGLRGRWEKILDSPETICDIAHNPPALKVNFARLDRLCKRGRTLTVVYGIMADKDLEGIAPMMPEGAIYIFTAPGNRRSMPAAELQARVEAVRPELSTCTAPDVAGAVRMALESAAAQANPLIYVGGSTFVVAEALSMFENNPTI